MQCPTCGNTGLQPKYIFCPLCGSPLPRASNVPKQEDAERTEQPGPPGNNKEFELGIKELQVINQQKGAPTKETEKDQSLTSPAHGATRKPAVEQEVTPTKSDQHLDGSTAPTPSSPQVEETVDSKLTTVQTEPNTTPPANEVKAESSEGQESLVSKEIHRGGNELSNPSAVVASSPSHTTEEEVRGPAELDESSPPDATPQEPPASQALSVIDEQKQGNKVKVVGEKKLTESRQGSLNDPTATPSSENGSYTKNAFSPEDPQQNQCESNDHSSLASNREENQTAEGSVGVSAGPVTRQAAKRNQQSGAAPSSAPSAGATETTRHPLEEPKNDGSGAEAKEVDGTTPGTWYLKTNTQQEENTGNKKGKKNKKKQGKDESNSEQPPPATLPPPTLQQVPPEDGVTVVFQVLLASNFKMVEESLFIRAHGEDLGNFQQNCVDMMAVGHEKSKDKDKLMLFRGQFTVSLDRACTGTCYKYVVVKKGSVYWEDLAEFPTYYSIINRALRIPKKDIQPGVTWNQFDGVAYVSGDQSYLSKFKGFFARDKTVENRTRALLCFMPKWKGFHVDETAEQINATEALVKLQNVVKCLTNVWTEESGYYRQRQPSNFDIKKVLLDHLRPKMVANVDLLDKCKIGSRDHVSAVVSTLAIILLVEKYKIMLKREEVMPLLSCLALEADPAAKKCSVYEAVVDEFSIGLRQLAAKAIENLCNQLMREAWTSNPEWLLAIPLLHFLREDSKPFEEPELGEWPQNEAWWGAQNLDIDTFQRSDKQDFSDVLPRLASAFEVDRLLKRTFLHAIPVWQLSKITLTGMFHISDICVALVAFFPSGLGKEKLKSVEQCMQAMVSSLEPEKETRSPQLEITAFSVSASLKLALTLIEVLSLRSDLELICLAIKLLFLSIQKWENGEERKAKERESVRDGAMRDLLSKLGRKLREHFYRKMQEYYEKGPLLSELQVWSTLLRVADGFQGVEEYRRDLTKQFLSRTTQMRETYLVEIFCEVNLDQYDRAIMESFTKLAFEAVEKIINSRQGSDAERAFESLSGSSLRDDAKYGELLSMLLTKSWPKTSETSSMSGLDPITVEFLLSWNAMFGYFKFFGDESGRGNILTAEGQATLSMAQSLLTALVERISNASVTVEILKLLMKYRQRFLELLKADSNVTSEETKVRVILEGEKRLNDRIEEIQQFQAVKEKALSFINMCDLINPVSVTRIKAKVHEDVSMYVIRNLCERKSDNQIEVTFFDLPPVIAEVLSPLDQVQESSTFQDLWVQYGKKAQTARKNDEAQHSFLSISNVVEFVWKPAYEAWGKVVSNTMNGSLTLGEVDKLFGSYKDRKEDLARELERIFNLSHRQPFSHSRELKALADKRAGQIQQYQHLHQYANAADTIWEFKDAMGFSGDFTVVEDLRNQLSEEFKQKPLNSIGHKFAEAGRALDCLDMDKAQCFKAVVDSRRLVEWLRTTITSTQELKVLVDLALISAGESDMETDRISSLHTSCLGFAPLIFDLKETPEREVNFDLLMKACDPVWKAVEADKTLPKKLYDTNRHLEWLKTVKESHGSVAMTSLVQAKMINSSGVYVVGQLLPEGGPQTEHGSQLLLDKVVRLTVPPKEGEGDVKTYSLDELKDLQSKLMLIAGKAEKGKDEVDTFVKNLEGIMRLATAYINLSESGFVYRMHWSQEFCCSKDQREGESIADELAAASTALEECYSKWKQDVSNARKEYRELNFFTTQQLILLRKEIAAACRSSQLHVDNLQVLTLMESVRPSLDSEHLKAAIQRAFKDTDLLDQTRGMNVLPSFTLAPPQGDFDPRESFYQNNNYTDKRPLAVGAMSQVQPAPVKKGTAKGISKLRRFLNAAEDQGYSEQVAVSALASLGVDADEDDLLLWCLEESDDADLESLYEEAMSDPVIKQEIYTEGTSDGLERHLEENRLWTCGNL